MSITRPFQLLLLGLLYVPDQKRYVHIRQSEIVLVKGHGRRSNWSYRAAADALSG